MIILGKNFKITDDHIVVKPIAKIIDNKIIMIEREKKVESFPNIGRVYTPNHLAKITPGNFMIYEVEPSHTYEKNIENSHYYTVIQSKIKDPLFEVIKIQESFEKEPNLIIEKIRNGFKMSVEVLPNILLETSDNYLLGPFRNEYNLDKKEVVIVENFEMVKYLIPIYDNSRNQLDISVYYDSYGENYRYFTLTYPENNNIINELDIATDDYVVKDVIRALRGREKFGDITRRVSQEINEWLKNSTFSEEFNVKRLKKAIKLINEIAPIQEDNDYKKYTNNLLSLPSVNNMVKKQVEEKFALEYKSFAKENKNIIKENKDLKNEFSIINKQIELQEKELNKLHSDIEKYREFMSNKKTNIEEEILNHYFQKLISSNLISDSKDKADSSVIENSMETTNIFESFNEAKNVLKQNLNQYGKRDLKDFILNYCLICLKFNQPLIIVGESSFKLAEIIQKSFSASKYQIVIPKTTEISFDIIDFINGKQEDHLNFTLIHNINVSSVALNLTGIFKQYESIETNNKLIFAFDSFEDSRFILEQLQPYLILDINQRSFVSSPFSDDVDLKNGQFHFKKEGIFSKPKLNFEESLENLLESILENDQIIEEDITIDLKNMFIRLVYTNQILGDGERSINYFPLLKDRINGDQDAK